MEVINRWVLGDFGKNNTILSLGNENSPVTHTHPSPPLARVWVDLTPQHQRNERELSEPFFSLSAAGDSTR